MDVVDQKVQHAQPFGLIEDAIFSFLSFIHDEHSIVKHTWSELPFSTHGSFSTILQFTVYNKQPAFLQRNSIFFSVPNLLEMEKRCDFVVISLIF